MQDVDWVALEGYDIEVSLRGNFESSRIRRLIKYCPDKKKPFICEDPSDTEKYYAWEYARVFSPRVQTGVKFLQEQK